MDRPLKSAAFSKSGFLARAIARRSWSIRIITACGNNWLRSWKTRRAGKPFRLPFQPKTPMLETKRNRSSRRGKPPDLRPRCLWPVEHAEAKQTFTRNKDFAAQSNVLDPVRPNQHQSCHEPHATTS